MTFILDAIIMHLVANSIPLYYAGRNPHPWWKEFKILKLFSGVYWKWIMEYVSPDTITTICFQRQISFEIFGFWKMGISTAIYLYSCKYEITFHPFLKLLFPLILIKYIEMIAFSKISAWSIPYCYDVHHHAYISRWKFLTDASGNYFRGNWIRFPIKDQSHVLTGGDGVYTCCHK